MPSVILVDPSGAATGFCDTLEAHTGAGKLHKAFSVYVFRKNGRELLIQKRAAGKMLWPGIWANTCCSHPREGEPSVAAGKRRLQEEMGCTCALEEAGTFVYRAEDPNGRGAEHEHVTILRGDVEDVAVRANPDEVSEWKWMNMDTLREDMRAHPDRYAPWFHRGLEFVL